MELSKKATFAEHVQELRNRLFWTVLFLLLGAGLGYFVHDTLILWLQRPLNESLYYTTPGGAFSFIIKVCTVFGFVLALPVLIYQIFAFFGPLIKLKTKRSFLLYIVCSFLLAMGGLSFAYFISLPAALHFLVTFGTDSNIKSLITANEYFNFVLTYMAGFAVLFQVPLIVLLVDKIKPIPPSKLLGTIRYVVLASFIVAAIITPTPDPINQALMAGPIILLYLMSVAAVALRSVARRKKVLRQQQSFKKAHQNSTQLVAKLPASLVSMPKKPQSKPLHHTDVLPHQVSVRPISNAMQRNPPIKQKPQLISDFTIVPQKSVR